MNSPLYLPQPPCTERETSVNAITTPGVRTSPQSAARDRPCELPPKLLPVMTYTRGRNRKPCTSRLLADAEDDIASRPSVYAGFCVFGSSWGLIGGSKLVCDDRMCPAEDFLNQYASLRENRHFVNCGSLLDRSGVNARPTPENSTIAHLRKPELVAIKVYRRYD